MAAVVRDGAVTVGCAASEPSSEADLAPRLTKIGLCSDVAALRESVERVAEIDVGTDGLAGMAAAVGDVLDDLSEVSDAEEFATTLDAIDGFGQQIRASADDPHREYGAGLIDAASSLARTASKLAQACG